MEPSAQPARDDRVSEQSQLIASPKGNRPAHKYHVRWMCSPAFYSAGVLPAAQDWLTWKTLDSSRMLNR
jgi:hypothetical protein